MVWTQVIAARFSVEVTRRWGMKTENDRMSMLESGRWSAYGLGSG